MNNGQTEVGLTGTPADRTDIRTPRAKRNPRVVAIAKISKVIDALPDDTSRQNVVQFILDEYGEFLKD